MATFSGINHLLKCSIALGKGGTQKVKGIKMRIGPFQALYYLRDMLAIQQNMSTNYGTMLEHTTAKESSR